MIRALLVPATCMAAILIAAPAQAARAALQQSSAAQPSSPSPSSTTAHTAAPRWQDLPRMQLEAIYAAPLADTVIQRLRDPIDGTICFLYSPIEAQHSAPSTSGYVTYGAANIGSLSCVAGSVLAIPAGPPQRGK